MNRKVSAPPGLDYSPITGEVANFSYGIIQADAAAPERTVEQAVFRRLFPVMKPKDAAGPWPSPTCDKWDVLLPRGAADELRDAQQLCRTFDRQGFGGLRDLLIINTLRFPEVDEACPSMKLHEVWELTRAFAHKRLVGDRRLPVIPVLHVPARAAKPGLPHAHLMILARQLLPSGLGGFVRVLLTEEGRAVIEQEWLAWRGNH
jgi:hypothetical protein